MFVNAQSLTTKTQFFYYMKYDLKGYPRSTFMTTFMPKSFKHIQLWTDLKKNINANFA